MTREQIAWWTPDGCRYADVPSDYQAAIDYATESGCDWYTAMQRFGWHEVAKWGVVSDASFNTTNDEIRVFCSSGNRSAPLTGIYYVVLDNIYGSPLELMVAPEHRAAFMLDKLPALIGALQGQEIAAELRMLRRAFAAWVRHGQGTNTLSINGDKNSDDIQDELENRREMLRKG
jgi:hypothetical protein